MTKFGVYALCKDQEDQVDGFMEMMRGVDHVLVVDIGSKDDSVLRLRNRGARVIELHMNSERADLNRIAALEAMPEGLDVCMCLELNQRLDYGWVDMIKSSWFQGCTRMTYWINEGRRRYYGDWLHDRHGYTWRYPIYEELIPMEPENMHHCEIDLRQDEPKIDLNIPLVETAISENMNIGYLRMMMARDCLLADQDDAVSPFYKGKMAVKRALECEDLTAQERAFTCSLGSLYQKYSANVVEEELWLMRAVVEDPDCREWWYHLAKFLHQRKHHQRALVAICRAESLGRQPNYRYNNLEPWSDQLYVLAAQCAIDAEQNVLADKFYTRGTRLFADSTELAKLYGEFLS